MARTFHLSFGTISYLFFFVTFLILIAFVGNLPFMPVTIDRGGPGAGAGWAALVNVALILSFAVQHSVMARQGFKSWWTKIIPASIERSVYVLATTVLLWVLMLLWHPMPATIWSVEHQAGQVLLWALFAAGWGIVLLSTFLINHFELFGLQQVWQGWKKQETSPPKFVQPFLYKWVRHPLYFGLLLAFWSIPAMTAGHLLFAVGMTLYIVIGATLEERDLVAYFGDEYRAYKSRVAMLVPGLKRGG
ncbi:MAG: isoprenylcysteine carboxylmethyltransferase family protein [Sphingobium sp.]|nr:isoprenylcysteine carboxylmethyltransferase family protein [Sphingobium sp.]MCP5400242.1 isoprenylcysteine carboxylmethyltransferase family protein [Sphingomonas sp.]